MAGKKIITRRRELAVWAERKDRISWPTHLCILFGTHQKIAINSGIGLNMYS